MTEGIPNLASLLVIGVAVGFVTIAAVTMTSFIKMSVVMLLLRNALGVQQTPPNIVIYTVAMLLSGYVMMPVMTKVYAAATTPGQQYMTFEDYRKIATKVEVPIKEFMLRFTNPGQRDFFVNVSQRVWGPEAGLTVGPDDIMVVVPAFVVSELQKAFEAGFLIYLPFIAVDLVTTAVLMAMGMSAVTPTIISVPFKIFLFVAIEGWTRLIHGLVLGYAS